MPILLDSATDGVARELNVDNTVSAKAKTVQEEEEEEEELWVSPFVPTKVDPLALMKENPKLTVQEARQQINAGFPTRSELLHVIPKHCFEKSVWRSLGFVVRDLLQTAFVIYLTHSVCQLSTDPPTEGGWSAWLLWRLAWNVYAVIMTYAAGGLWVLAHECGHGAFSDYAWVNGLVGWTLHSFLLVPYFSWAFSHAKHHRHTNDLVDGETHCPPTAEDMGLIVSTDDENKTTTITHRASKEQVVQRMGHGPQPKTAATHMMYCFAQIHQILGDDGFAIFGAMYRLLFAFQIYVLGITSTGLNGADGKPIPKGTFPDHFRPSSQLFPKKMFWKVVASDVGMLLTLSGLTYCTYLFGFRAVWFWYGGPYLLINAFLVATTWLHHTNPSVPHFDADNWTWMKGGLAGTIDRPMGPITNFVSHNISSTHVVHHLFHQIPHYHAVEATEAIRDYLEPKGLYNFDPDDMDDALWRCAKTCHFIESNTQGVQYYQSLTDLTISDSAATVAKDDCKKEQ